MATAIHHGAPGSFKTFTLVQRHAIPALMQGRAVVCNIRGFDDLARVKAAFPNDKFPDSARIVWVDTTTKAGRLKMACWFHWVPFGALIIIDETQQIYPDRRDFKLESLDRYIPEPGDFIEDIGLPEGRPEDVFTAYDKQRHYNWDIFCSTPNIAKVKKEIREVSEWAYRHRNLSGVLPWWRNKWREFQHDPENSGKSPSHYAGSPKDYQADRRVFACYSSTATGSHSDTKTHESLLKDPKLLMVAVLVIFCLAFSFYALFVKGKSTAGRPADAVPAKAADPAGGVHDYGRPDPVGFASAPPVIPSKHAFTSADLYRYSVHGVLPDQVLSLPPGCAVNSKRVSCPLPNRPDITAWLKNYSCAGAVCTAYFFINAPIPDNNPVKPVLASAF